MLQNSKLPKHKIGYIYSWLTKCYYSNTSDKLHLYLSSNTWLLLTFLVLMETVRTHLVFHRTAERPLKTSEKDIEITAVKLVYQPLKMLTLSQCLMSNRVKHRQPVVEHSVILFRWKKTYVMKLLKSKMFKVPDVHWWCFLGSTSSPVFWHPNLAEKWKVAIT